MSLVGSGNLKNQGPAFHLGGAVLPSGIVATVAFPKRNEIGLVADLMTQVGNLELVMA